MSHKESQNIEWKESWRDEYIRWVCGFANAQGGKLIIGKNDKGAILGVANAKKLFEDIPNKIKDILGIIALLNAIVHKDYSGGSPIQISVYEDKIYFWNDGQLPDNWSVAQLLAKHASKPFNPLIANAFFRTGMIESWGRGIEKIQRECELAGVPAPEYRTDASGLMVKFTAKPEMTVKTPVKMSGQMSEEMTEQIIALLKSDGRLTSATLALRIGKSARTIERNLRKLRESGVIEHIGPNKGGHWVVKEKT